MSCLALVDAWETSLQRMVAAGVLEVVPSNRVDGLGSETNISAAPPNAFRFRNSADLNSVVHGQDAQSPRPSDNDTLAEAYLQYWTEYLLQVKNDFFTAGGDTTALASFRLFQSHFATLFDVTVRTAEQHESPPHQATHRRYYKFM